MQVFSDNGQIMVDESVNIANSVDAAIANGCSEANYLLPYVSDYTDQAEEYLGYVGVYSLPPPAYLTSPFWSNR